jgi:rod shape-determining protein MreD
VRKSVFAAVALGLAIIVQLTVVNRLRLPGGGVPDLVLVLVASLAIADGPLRGLMTGFIAGLCLDLAPPGSAQLGEYALVFCLVGWAAGKLSGLAARSALGSLAMLAAVVALGEAVVAGVSLALDPAQVNLTDVRHVLPYSVVYDLVILPFAVWLSVRAQARAERAIAQRERSGVVADHASHAGKRNKPREPRLAEGFARPHDGWVGTRPAGLAGHSAARRRPVVPHGLRPANGVAGSAVTGATRRPAPAAPPVNLRLAAKRRRDGALGNAVGSSLGRHPGLHPGLRTTSGRFRPHGGAPGGSAAMQSAAIGQPTWRRPVAVSFGARRGDASVGRLLGTSLSALVTPRSRRIAEPRFSRQPPAVTPRPHRAAEPRFSRQSPAVTPRPRRAAEPRFSRQSLAVTPRPRRAAEPRFRRQSSGVTPGLATRLNASRAADQQAIMSARRRSAATAPRLRLGTRRRGDGVVAGTVLGGKARGGSGFATAAHGARAPVRPTSPRFHSRPLAGSGSRRPAKQPRFGYGRHSVLSFLARRPGGKWLAGRQAGTRSGVWLIGRRTGGIR